MAPVPRGWEDRPQWRVLAAGPGAARAFHAAWDAWRGDARRPALLHFVALLEQPPANAPAGWRGLVPGFHRISYEHGRVLLTLCVGERAALLREQAFRADAVLLDGVDSAAPWTFDSLKALTRLCRRGAVLETDAVGEAVRKDLQTCGWQVGRGTPLTGRYDPAWEVKALAEASPAQPGDAVVVGAGLAGAAAAASLARRGWQVRVLDAASAPASGASALPAGLLAPHQSPDDNLLSRLSRAGVRITLEEARQRLAAGLEWECSGVLEWRGEDRRALAELGDELAPWTREASDARKQAAGIAPGDAAWWHENAAWIEPAALVRSWLREPGVRFVGGQRAGRIVREGERWIVRDAQDAVLATADLVVVAAALGSDALAPGRLQLHPVGGQVTWAPHAGDAGDLPPFPVNGNGHFIPRVPLVDRGAWITGSSYRRNEDDDSVRGEDTAANLARVRQVLPRAAAAMQAATARGEIRSWAGVRCASADRRPVVGELAPGLWVSTAMGSRGLTFAALCAELLAARLHGEPLPLEARLAQALDATRQA